MLTYSGKITASFSDSHAEAPKHKSNISHVKYPRLYWLYLRSPQVIGTCDTIHMETHVETPAEPLTCGPRM